MNIRQTSFTIQGMREACANCAVTIERALTRLDGVIAAHVNFATERATVVYDPEHASLSEMIRTVQGKGFDVPLTRVVLSAKDLFYVTSARVVERVLSHSNGVAHVQVDLPAQRIGLDVLAERVNRDDYVRRLAALGLSVVETSSLHAIRDFGLRAIVITGLTLLSLLSAGAHAGLFDAGRGAIHTPLVVMSAAVVIAYGVGLRFFHLAFNACVHGEFDFGVLVALVASAGLLVGLPLALVSAMNMIATSGFLLAMLLTAGWFIVRGVELWNSSRSNRTTINHAPTTQASLGIISNGSHR